MNTNTQTGERADCTVRAVSACFGIPYTEAHARLASLGRKPRCRFKFSSAVNGLGLEQRPEFSCRSLQSVIPELPPRCIVRHARHVFAVVDGVPIDPREVNKSLKIKMVYALK